MEPQPLQAVLELILSGLATAKDSESTTLDFKQPSKDGPGETKRILLDAALCLANSKGGQIVLGVADKSTGPSAFLGTDLDVEDVRQYIFQGAKPQLLTDVMVIQFGEARLLSITVPESSDIHTDSKGRATQRLGTSCVGMDSAAQVRLREERAGYDWSARFAAVGVVPSGAALDAARRRLDVSPKPARRALAALRDEDLIRALGVVDGDDRLTRAGQVLLSPAGATLTYSYRDTPAGEPQVIEKLSGSLLEIYTRVMDLIQVRRRLTPVTLPDGQQLHIEDFPELAVREALTNALIHRDYSLNEPVTIEHSPSVLVISSPGPLVAGVRLDNILTHPSKPRNRSLAAATSTLELAEEIGRGVDRMYREMVRSGRPAPTITDTDHVRVVLVGGAPNTNIARYVAQLSSAVRDDTDAMLTILRLCQVKTVTAEQMAPRFQRSIDESEASLRYLASDQVGMLEVTRQTARRSHPTYRFREEPLKQLGTAVPYIRHKADDIERRVIQHLREYDRVTNQTVQNLFNVKSDRANQILKELRERGIIIKTSEAQRGPSVEYGPGPQFPPKPTRKRRTKQSSPGDDDEVLPGL